MILIDGLGIKLHKGNSAGFTLHLTGEDLPEDGTLVRFFVKKTPHYTGTIIEKICTITDACVDVDFTPADTENLFSGEYVWNLEVLFNDGADPYTVIENAPSFQILPEVGNRF